jgi:hypothetical protein
VNFSIPLKFPYIAQNLSKPTITMKKMIFSSLISMALTVSLLFLTSPNSFAGNGENKTKSSAREIKKADSELEKTSQEVPLKENAEDRVPEHLHRKLQLERDQLKLAKDEKDIKRIKANILYLEEMKASYNQAKPSTK